MSFDTHIKFTYEHLRLAKSRNGTLNGLQFKALEYSGPFKGWKKKLIGKYFKTSQIEKFISLKNAHLKKKGVKQKPKKPDPWKKLMLEEIEARKKPTSLDDVYSDPRWIEKRKEIYRRDAFKCQSCGRGTRDGVKINAHHLLYESGKEVWDVPEFYLITLCEGCHKKEHSKVLFPPKKHFSEK